MPAGLEERDASSGLGLRMSNLTVQITELNTPLDASKMLKVRNAPRYAGEPPLEWLKTRYRGNKPEGGLWTSTYTKDEPYLSDWQYGRLNNIAIQLAYPPEKQENLRPYLVYPKKNARVLVIDSFQTAVEFTSEFHMASSPELARKTTLLATAEITDWSSAFRKFDAIHLTAEAADEIAFHALEARFDSAFHTWNCEATLWGRWMFDRVEDLVVESV